MKLPEPDLYARELIANGGGIWLGCHDKGVCEQAHDPGETGEEVRSYYTAEQVRAIVAAELQACLKICEERAHIWQNWSDIEQEARHIGKLIQKRLDNL